MRQNITERKRTEAALRESEERLKEAERAAQIGHWQLDAGTGELVRSDQDVRNYGLEPGQMAPTFEAFVQVVLPDDRDMVKARVEKALRTLVPGQYEFRTLWPDGQVRSILAKYQMDLDDDGNLVRMLGVNQDITERKEAEEALRRAHEQLEDRVRQRTEALRESEATLNAFFENAPICLATYDDQLRYTKISAELARLNGIPAEEHIGRTIAEVIPAQAAIVEPLFRELLDTGKPQLNIEFTTGFPGIANDEQHWLSSRFPILDPDGKSEGFGTFVLDITERKRAEEALRQSQKMEAVGQLTGGVAHEFNNLLMVIVGNLEYAKDKTKDSQEVDRYVERALAAADRGAVLTHRLLAFSRKQSLRPRPINLNELKRGLLDLLRPTLGETIEVEIVFAHDLWPALVDPEQIETAILSLAINARDAMPGGGRLTIEAANVRLGNDDLAEYCEAEPGDYVLLSVRDAGTGMPPEVMEHVFEPFYTTKEVGKGTGLGLSTVHGFVKQSGGYVEIASEVGSGTTVKIYLPRSTEASAQSDEELAVEPEYRGKGETILVVEDEPAVRELFVHMLTDLGYEIVEAGDGKAALQVLSETPGISLLFTDVILPKGMSGGELAHEARRRWPDIKVLHTSGYTDESIVRHGQIDEGVELLRKPYRKSTLARKVREALNSDD